MFSREIIIYEKLRKCSDTPCHKGCMLYDFFFQKIENKCESKQLHVAQLAGLLRERWGDG